MKQSTWVVSALMIGLTANAAAASPSVTPLADPGEPDAWQPFQWNRAEGTVRAGEEYPIGVEAPEGQSGKSLRLDVQFGPGRETFEFFQVFLAEPARLPADAEEMRLWVKGTDTPHYLQLFFRDADGEDVKIGPKPGRLDFRGWQQLRAALPEDWARPLTFRGFGLHNYGTSEPHKLEVYLTGFEVRNAKAAAEATMQAVEEPGLEIESEDVDGMVLGADSLTVTLRPKGIFHGEAVEVCYEMSDWNGRVVASDALPISRERARPQTVRLPMPRFGPYFLEAKLLGAGPELLGEVSRRLLRPVDVPRLSFEQRANSSIGVNTHHQAHWESLAAMGIHWARDYSWGWLQFGEQAPMSPNRFNFRAVWDAADAAGITILPCMQRVFRTEDGKLYIEDEEKIRDAYERLSKAFPEVPYWELDNESDLRFHGGLIGFEEYFRTYLGYIRAAAEGLRRAGQGAEVALNGDAGIYVERTRRLLASPVKGDFSVVNFHFYTGSVAPELSTQDYNTGARETLGAEMFLDKLRQISRLAHEHGKEAWFTEVGWGEKYEYSVGLRRQAMFLARMYLLARWCDVDKTFWFFDRDTGGQSRFSEMGLLDGENRARPAAGALAAVSRMTALAEFAGTIDLGADRWCLLFRREKDWVAAVWSVEQEHGVPEALKEAEALDLFGNSTGPERITPEVTYFLLDELPPGWDAQRQAEMLSPMILNVSPGGNATARLRLPESLKEIRWHNLPDDVTGSRPGGDAEIVLLPARCGIEAAMGKHPVEIAAMGEGWKKTWRVTLNVVAPVLVDSQPYRPGGSAELTIRPGGAMAMDLELIAPDQAVRIDPSDLRAKPEGTTATVTTTKSATGPQRIEMRTESGLTAEHWLRPAFVDVPRVDDLTLDGKLADWPRSARMGEAFFAASPEQYRAEARIGWSPEGLWLAVRYEVRDLQSGRAGDFWKWPVAELFVDTTGNATEGWPKTSHQFWFLPVRENGSWRAAPGEWKRGDAIEATIPDDPRCRTGIFVADGYVTVEAFVPAEALGAAPKAGATWRAAIAAQDALPTEPSREAAWPMLKRNGLLQGASAWADLNFVE